MRLQILSPPKVETEEESAQKPGAAPGQTQPGGKEADKSKSQSPAKNPQPKVQYMAVQCSAERSGVVRLDRICSGISQRKQDAHSLTQSRLELVPRAHRCRRQWL